MDAKKQSPDGSPEGMNTVADAGAVTGGFTFSVATVVYLVVSLLVSLLVLALKLDSASDAYLYIGYIAAPVAIAAASAVSLRVRKTRIKSVCPVACSPKYYLIGLMLIFGLLFSLGWVNEVIVKGLTALGYTPKESYLPDLGGAKVIPALLVIAVLPAVFEEFLFRGIILNSIENSVGGIATVFIVGMCFSLFHTSPEQTVYQFICGCLFALIAVRSRSILPSVMMHFINNALIIILNACNLFDEGGNLIISGGGYIAITVLSALSLIGAVVWLILDKHKLAKGNSGAVKAFFKYASVGIAVLALLWIITLISGFITLPEVG